MRLICLNAWGGTLADRLIAYVAAQAPDVLCLQEVTHTPESNQTRLTYRDGAQRLEQHANLLRDVAAVLPDHRATFCPAAQGVLWDGDRPVPSQFGLATFVHTSLSVVEQVQGFIHKSFSPDGYGAHPRPRNAHAIRIHDFAGNRGISITQLHGLRDPAAAKADTPERAAQAQRILKISDAVSRPGDLRVICGDFNVLPDSATLAMLAAHGFVELATTRGTGGTRNSLYSGASPFADYMLVDGPVADFRIVRDAQASDHCPLELWI